MEKKRKKVLVTGGAGFIGSNLTALLCEKGLQVTVLDDLSSGFKHLVPPEASFIKGNVGDAKLLSRILPGMEAVFHLAATSTTTYSLSAPQKYFENNFMNTVTLLEAMRKAAVKKIIYSSSASSYGESGDQFLKEGEATKPISPYGASKYIVEPTLNAYYHCFGIESVALRYFNVYGPNDEQQGTRAVPKWAKAALTGKPIELYWRGEQKRDYIFVRDIARANFFAFKHCIGARVYNVGTGTGVWMKDIIKEFERIMGRKLVVKEMGERPGDPKFAMADIGKIEKELGWRPETDLPTGLKHTLDYFRKKL
ncbi:MAG: UDP-glucose 4-epimerase [Parcubacteria group bacterium Greene0416_79]|nr:MAG: UDP-glucose 4-epimerase [Parcubacteria group bacterium Greene0416_79]